LVAVRRNRVLGPEKGGYGATYVDAARVADEVAHARRLFADRGWPVIDVTRRSIEETAAAIINLLHARQGAGFPA
jgi:regulator of PEP synthase PpsR (kinase-PPPase family)